MATNPKVIEELEKLENKVKLSNLLSGKKFADLELSIGSLEEKFKEISTEFPKLKEKAEETEDLLNLVNLGMAEFKRNLDDFNNRFTNVQKVPEDSSEKMAEYESKLNSLDLNVKKLSETLGTLDTIKEDLTETIKKSILPELQALKSNIETNKTEMEHVKKDMDTFSENKARIEELSARIDRLSDVVNKKMSSYSKTEVLPRAEITADKASVEEIYTKIKGIYDDINSKIIELNSTKGAGELSQDSEQTLKRINVRIDNLEKYYNELVDTIHTQLKNIKSDLSKPTGAEGIRKELDELERVFISHDKSLVEYKKQIENRFRSLEGSKPEESLSKGITEEISSLKEITTRLLMENNEFRNLTRDLRVSHLETVKPETFAKLLDKVTELEKKMGELEENVKKGNVMPQLENTKKEIESLKKILEEKESSMESKISKIEKKMKEESAIHPLVLE